MDTTYLEDQIKNLKDIIQGRATSLRLMKVQQKEDEVLLRQMEKSSQKRKNADTEQKKG